MTGRGRAVHVKRPEKPKPRKKVGQPESDSDSSQYGSVSHTPPPSVNDCSETEEKVLPIPEKVLPIPFMTADELEAASEKEMCEYHMTIIKKGAMLEHTHKEFMDKIFVEIRVTLRQNRLSYLGRTVLLELVEFRAREWQSDPDVYAYYCRKLEKAKNKKDTTNNRKTVRPSPVVKETTKNTQRSVPSTPVKKEIETVDLKPEENDTTWTSGNQEPANIMKSEPPSPVVNGEMYSPKSPQPSSSESVRVEGRRSKFGPSLRKQRSAGQLQDNTTDTRQANQELATPNRQASQEPATPNRHVSSDPSALTKHSSQNSLEQSNQEPSITSTRSESQEDNILNNQTSPARSVFRRLSSHETRQKSPEVTNSPVYTQVSDIKADSDDVNSNNTKLENNNKAKLGNNDTGDSVSPSSKPPFKDILTTPVKPKKSSDLTPSRNLDFSLAQELNELSKLMKLTRDEDILLDTDCFRDMSPVSETEDVQTVTLGKSEDDLNVGSTMDKIDDSNVISSKKKKVPTATLR